MLLYMYSSWSSINIPIVLDQVGKELVESARYMMRVGVVFWWNVNLTELESL